jgi:hypothetical protein
MLTRSPVTVVLACLTPLLLVLSMALSGCVGGSAVSPGSGGTTSGGGNPSTLAAYLPNPQRTPGETLDVTKADICEPGYSKRVRDVPESVKNQAYQEYGLRSHKAGEYEVDHLISLELGGSNSIRNLWPQSYTGEWNAHMKDKLEDRLHALVCKGSLDLKTAQLEISTDWIAAYQKYEGK